MANPGVPETRPRLVRGGAEAGRTPATGEPEVRGRRRGPGLSWVLAALLAFALGAAVLQTVRLDRVTAQADELRTANGALQAELADAEARIQGYEQQRTLVREAVADLAERVGALHAIVRSDGGPAIAPEPPAATPVEPPVEPPAESAR